jgi:hypothetical protein
MLPGERRASRIDYGDRSRWRRDQRERRRRLTTRGRATIGVSLALLAALLSWIIDPTEPMRAANAPATPDVAAGAPRVVALEAEDSKPIRVPRDIFTRLPVTKDVVELPRVPVEGGAEGPHLFEWIDVSGSHPHLASPLRVEYTFDADLTQHVFRVLRRGRVALGNVVLLDPTTGRVLAYASTDVERFAPTRHYPAASLVKVITAAAVLDRDPRTAELPCRFRGSPYRLTPSRIDPPAHGREVSFRRALATSNNQCFAQLAVHSVGMESLLDTIDRFGWRAHPAPAHAAGVVDPGEDRYDVGRLGSGLAGSRITPLHAAQLAATLVHGELVTPRWIQRVSDALGADLAVPAQAAPRRVLSPEVTGRLRSMLVDTTRSGTARRAFRDDRGRPMLGDIRVAGKTGSLSGTDPTGRYEWFVGVAPAESPKVAVASVLVQGDLWWRNASQIAAEVLQGVFCERRRCRAEYADRFVRIPDEAAELARFDGSGS